MSAALERPFRAYEGDESYVFVCYAHDDKAEVYPEITRLRDAGFNIWYDEGIAPGSEWSETLAQRIQGSSVFLYFVSPRSVESEHCRSEVTFAQGEGCRILAVHLEPTELPAGLKLTLSYRQAILKYEHPKDAYEAKLSHAIHGTERDEFQESPAGTLTVGEWTLDVDSQRLTRGDESHALDPKQLSVLLHLVDRAPEVVTIEGLLARTWPDVVVGDNVVHQAIAHLRRALGDDARDPEYIETLPRRGYRLLASVGTPAASPQAVALPPKHRRRLMVFASLTVAAVVAAALFWWSRDTGSPTTLTPPTVAVLTFTDLSKDEELGYLANALAFDLNEQIREVGFEVLPRSLTVGRTASQLPEDVTYVVDGFLQPQDAGITVGAQLVELPSGRQLWSETFLGTRDDPVELQQQIATRVARYFGQSVMGLEAPENVAQGPRNPAAREAYLEYLKYELGGDLQQIIASLERTLELDPTWAAGYLLLADSYVVLWALPDGEVWAAKAREALAEAQRRGLDDDDPAVIITQAQLTLRLEHDYDAAERLYRRAAVMQKDFTIYSGTYAFLMLISGLAEEAEPVLARITDTYATVPPFWSFLAQARGTNGDLEGAYQAARQYENLTPANTFTAFHFPLYSLLTRTGRVEEAQRRMAQLEGLIADGHAIGAAPMVQGILKRELALATNDPTTALASAEAAAKAGDHASAGLWFLLLGDPRAREELTLAFAMMDPAYLGLAMMVLGLEHSDSPIFREALDSIGLTRGWRLELCWRASTMPPETGISCEPTKYAIDEAGT